MFFHKGEDSLLGKGGVGFPKRLRRVQSPFPLNNLLRRGRVFTPTREGPFPWGEVQIWTSPTNQWFAFPSGDGPLFGKGNLPKKALSLEIPLPKGFSPFFRMRNTPIFFFSEATFVFGRALGGPQNKEDMGGVSPSDFFKPALWGFLRKWYRWVQVSPLGFGVWMTLLKIFLPKFPPKNLSPNHPTLRVF